MLDASHDPQGHGTEPEHEEEHQGSNLRQIVATVLLLGALIAVGLWLTGAMRGAANIQDCVASGRTNCAPIR